MRGFCNAEGDYVAVMDADMQDPPSLLPSNDRNSRKKRDTIARHAPRNS